MRFRIGPIPLLHGGISLLGEHWFRKLEEEPLDEDFFDMSIYDPDFTYSRVYVHLYKRNNINDKSLAGSIFIITEMIQIPKFWSSLAYRTPAAQSTIEFIFNWIIEPDYNLRMKLKAYGIHCRE